MRAVFILIVASVEAVSGFSQLQLESGGCQKISDIRSLPWKWGLGDGHWVWDLYQETGKLVSLGEVLLLFKKEMSSSSLLE